MAGQKVVTVQACLPAGREGMARVFAVMAQILLSITRVAVRICQILRFCLTAWNKSKNRDKQLTNIVRVIVR
jgi:hypothetical protein